MKLFRFLVSAVILGTLFGPMAVRVAAEDTGSLQTYIVLYKTQAVPADASVTLATAGGTLVYSYNQIGVAIAQSDNAAFGANLAADTRVQGAVATTNFATSIDNAEFEVADVATDGIPAPGDDPLSGLQWDMVQIHAPEARAINGGSPSVVVGDIDTGLDWTHPDLAPNVDFANSVSCVTGAPNTDPAAWMDDNGHGTHTAGTIAAAKNDIGIVGVAPNVKIAGIKAGNAAGFFFPEAVVCSFMWAGTHHIQVTNNSYFADPWLFNCRNDPEQRAIWEAERRAIKFAISKGTVVVAAEGNQRDDLAHPTQDATSPDDTTPVTRDITNACAVVPVEVPGVIGVTANGNKMLKSYYSSYGVGSADVIAPGGDRRFQVTPAAVNGLVLSTFPGNRYAYAQGTSMASPHVAGVAALIASLGIKSPGKIAARITGTADHIACPSAADMVIYLNWPALDGGAPQVCQGDLNYNSFNGHGQVNALSAITH